MELLKEDGCIGEKAFHGEKECFFQPFYNVEKKRININLSPEVCEVPETVPNIMQILRKYEVSRSEVCMEITEMCKVRNAENFSCMLEQLSSQGM